MKVVIILVFVMMSILTPSLAYGADSNLEFGTRFIPTKLVEGKEGIIQIFATNGASPVPEPIPGLTVTSLDSKILRVQTVGDSESGLVTELTVKGIKSGSTKLFLAAPGFVSQELPVTVYGNVLNQEKLLVKTIPETFSSDGPSKGLIYVELVDEDGFPVKANERIEIFLTASNTSLLSITNPNIVIEKDEYFVGTHFEVIPTGNTEKAFIYVTAEDMEAKSTDITIDEMEDLTVKLYFFRDEVNVSNSATGHIIVQLQKEDEEEPVIASKDILVKYKLSNEFTINQVGEKTSTIKIKKGEYWGSDTVTFPAEQQGDHLITISSAEPLALESQTVRTVQLVGQNEGNRFVQFESLPILATGQKELIGMIHLEDTDGNPIISDDNQEIEINSSDSDFLSIDNVFLTKGSGSVLVYGDVSSSVPDEDTIRITPSVELEAGTSATFSEPEVFGPSEDSLSLVAESGIPKILANTEFPIVLYLKEDDKVVEFPSDSEVFASPSDIFDVKTRPILDGNYLVSFNTEAIETGSDTVKFTINDFADASVSLESLSMKPANIIIDHSETIFTGTNDIFSIQLVNSAGLPVFATEDIDVTFVVDDPSKIQIPQTLTIPKGEYFAIFDAGPKSGGLTQVSALTDGMPISTTDIQITSRTPTLLLEVPELIENNEVFTVKVAANQDDRPLDGLKVNWEIDGGVLQLSDKKTGSSGEATASIFSTSGKAVKVKASVSGSYYDPNSISKTVSVNQTSSEFLAFAEEEEEVFVKPEIGGIDPVIIIVPVVLVLMGYLLIKKGVLKIKNPKVIEQVQQPTPQETL